MKKIIILVLSMLCISSSLLANTSITVEQPKVVINGKTVVVPDGLLEEKGMIFVPIRWFALQMGAESVEWHPLEKTLIIETPTYNEMHQYLSYLNGITSTKQGDIYELPERVKSLELPPYPLKGSDGPMLWERPITIKIDDEGYSLPFASYSYLCHDGKLYLPIGWLNTIFLADIQEKDGQLLINYPTPADLQQKISEIEAVLLPRTPEEALALWARGQQVRSGALQYISLSPMLKEKVMAEKGGWVTGGSSPSAGKIEVVDKTQVGENAFKYTLGIEELLQGKVSDTLEETIVIEPFVKNGKTYYLISKAEGELNFFSILN